MHWAAFGGHLPCVKYVAAKLGDRKFDLNMQAESCLHKAVEGGSLRVVRYLIDKCGLDPKLQNGVRHNRNIIMHMCRPIMLLLVACMKCKYTCLNVCIH